MAVIPWIFYLVAVVAFGVSAVRDAPAWGIAVQALAWGFLIQIGLAIFSVLLRLEELLEGRKAEDQSRAAQAEVGSAQAAD